MTESTAPPLSAAAVAALEAIAAHLWTVPDAAWDFTHWFLPESEDCGTAGCAVGHALQARLPEVVATGLFALPPSSFPPWRGLQGWPAYFHGKDTLIGFAAITAAFGLPTDAAEYLFDSQAYLTVDATPAVVAARIRDYIACGRPSE